MAILIMIAAVLFFASKYITSHREILQGLGGVAMVATIILLMVNGLANIEAKVAENNIEALQMDNYRIEGEVMDILYYYHTLKYPDGAMSYDPEPSIYLVTYYPEAHSNRVIIELVNSYYTNLRNIAELEGKYNLNKQIELWTINFNLW